MTYFNSWEEFAKAAERLYMNNPLRLYAWGVTKACNSNIGSIQCRYVIKYRHCSGKLMMKMTDDKVCLQYRTEHTQDIRKMEKLTSQLIRHMASKEK